MTLFERQNASVNKFALTLKDFYTVWPTAPHAARRLLAEWREHGL